jgi:hypothetical protein
VGRPNSCSHLLSSRHSPVISCSVRKVACRLHFMGFDVIGSPSILL